MNNRFLFILLSAGNCFSLYASNTNDKPNIVVILADDLGWGDISCHGSSIQTPNIDNLFNEGVELTRHYSAPVSSPTRAGLMTGRYPSRFGIRKTVIPPWRDYGLDENQETMADLLGKNGYKNRAIIGKWHLGHSRKEYYPLNRGFTHFYGCLNGAIHYFTHERDGEIDWHNDWETSYDKGYSTDLIAAEAAECISKYSEGSEPYFLYVAFNAPHSPYMAPEDEIAEHISLSEYNALKNKRDKNGWAYRAMVSRLDDGIGKILESIKESGESENTIVFFMSDNGGVPNFEPYSTNRPYRGSKFTEFEGGVHVSAAICWKKEFGAKRKIEEVTSFVDLLPTFAEIVKSENPEYPYDGISLYPLLKGETDVLERDVYLGVGAAVNKNYKMILAGKNPKIGLTEDFFVNLLLSPEEQVCDSTNMAEKQRMKKFIIQYDTIRPTMPELPFDYGKEGFKAPHEWKVPEY